MNVGVESAQPRLGVVRVDGRKVVRHLLVDDDKDLDALARLALQEAVEAPLLCEGGGNWEGQLDPTATATTTQQRRARTHRS